LKNWWAAELVLPGPASGGGAIVPPDELPPEEAIPPEELPDEDEEVAAEPLELPVTVPEDGPPDDEP
jgi:hypothetical protein